MTTIPLIVSDISRTTQRAFAELIKMVLRKSIRPALNPMTSHSRIFHNAYPGYDRGFIPYNVDDAVNKYHYWLTNDCLGWMGENFATFNFMYKSTRRHLPKPYLIRNPTIIDFENLIVNCSTKMTVNTISNRRGGNVYVTSAPYSECFKELNSIGEDIIFQIDPLIATMESAKMSTARLRVKLYNLELALSTLLLDSPDIYLAYIEMILLINSITNTNIVWLIQLLGNLAFQPWCNLLPSQQQTYLDVFGPTFIKIFNSNQLISILLQSGESELILTASYLYPVLKMLFVVFGYNLLTPVLAPCFNGLVDDYPNPDVCIPTPPINPPINPVIYDQIRIFHQLYPTLSRLMGGYENFPVELMKMNCGNIPPNYECLVTIPQFLWRFNNFSYCHYIDYVNSRKIEIALGVKINNKVRYLKSL